MAAPYWKARRPWGDCLAAWAFEKSQDTLAGFSEVPTTFRAQKSCFIFAVSIILKIMQWNYQLTKQNWPVYELGTGVLFNWF